MIAEIKTIEVYYRKDLVGTLQSDPETGNCVFEYDATWLFNGFSISPTELPLQPGLFHASNKDFAGGFAVFEDSLPDGYGLYLLNRILKEKGSSLRDLSALQKLSIIGSSGMGALSYHPKMDGFLSQNEVLEPSELDVLQSEALKILSEKGEGNVSLLYYNSANSGGARPKAIMLTKDGRHFLVKFRHVYDPEDIGATELLYMQAASECGINVPPIRLFNDRYFGIERFDISQKGDREHVLTAAALLQTDFRNQTVDYTNLLALTGYLTQGPDQVEEMFRRMVFNLVAINKDDHAKNFSFICKNGKWTLAPAYDLTYSPAGSNGEHATSLYFNGNPGLDLVLKAGTEIRIPKNRCLEIIEKVEEICQEKLPRILPLTKKGE